MSRLAMEEINMTQTPNFTLMLASILTISIHFLRSRLIIRNNLEIQSHKRNFCRHKSQDKSHHRENRLQIPAQCTPNNTRHDDSRTQSDRYKSQFLRPKALAEFESVLPFVVGVEVTEIVDPQMLRGDLLGMVVRVSKETRFRKVLRVGTHGGAVGGICDGYYRRDMTKGEEANPWVA